MSVLHHTEHSLLQMLRTKEAWGRKDCNVYSLHIMLACVLDACVTHCKTVINYLGL